MDKSSEADRKVPKKSRQSTPGGTTVEGQVKMNVAIPSYRAEETERQKEVSTQLGKYLLEQFSVPGFRSHATVALIDRDRIQFYHANHSVVLVSSAIDFGTNDTKDGLDKLIATVIAFSRLSLHESGILSNRGNRDLVISELTPDSMDIQEGNMLTFVDEEGKAITLTYGKLISREPSLVGRSTAVLHATSNKWKGLDLVVKISWPSSGRVSETEFLNKAIKAAEGTPAKWALNHLPLLLFQHDVVFKPNSTTERVSKLFENADIVNGKYKYEKRTLRVIVQGRLRPLMTLTDVRDIAQVLVDVACGMHFSLVPRLLVTYANSVHRWLYKEVGILHRDLGPDNIMCRIIEGKVRGVLTDFDLSSLKTTLDSGRTNTSQQRSGMPPYMAYGLLGEEDPVHLYRHDLESLFYVMLMLAARYEIQAPGEGRETGGLRTRDKQKLPLKE